MDTRNTRRGSDVYVADAIHYTIRTYSPLSPIRARARMCVRRLQVLQVCKFYEFSACWLSGNSPPIPIHFKDIIQTLMSLGASQYDDLRTFVTDTQEIQQEEGVSKLSNGI